MSTAPSLDLEPLVYTAEQVAQLLQVSTRTVYEWVAQGDLPKFGGKGRRVLIPRRALERLLEGGAA
jgi:excisionase family DNA binding protein